MKDCNEQLKELVSLTKQYIQDMKKSGVTHIAVDRVNPVRSRPAEGTATFRQVGTASNGVKTLQQLYEEIKDCNKCNLCKGRTKFVFGEGSPDAELVFVGEAPGYEEDKQGRPFVGRAGQLLTKIIEAMGLKREDVYICNVLKCRPPDNRMPLPAEIEACKPHLVAQLSLLRKKKIICCLGVYATHGLLGLDLPMKEMRGNWYEYNGTPVIVTYHPAYLLRNPDEKRKVWNDMKKVKECLATKAQRHEEK